MVIFSFNFFSNQNFKIITSKLKSDIWGVRSDFTKMEQDLKKFDEDVKKRELEEEESKILFIDLSTS